MRGWMSREHLRFCRLGMRIGDMGSAAVIQLKSEVSISYPSVQTQSLSVQGLQRYRIIGLPRPCACTNEPTSVFVYVGIMLPPYAMGRARVVADKTWIT